MLLLLVSSAVSYSEEAWRRSTGNFDGIAAMKSKIIHACRGKNCTAMEGLGSVRAVLALYDTGVKGREALLSLHSQTNLSWSNVHR